jgi:hypothetical protein
MMSAVLPYTYTFIEGARNSIVAKRERRENTREITMERR